jgi:hypothetical protein
MGECVEEGRESGVVRLEGGGVLLMASASGGVWVEAGGAHKGMNGKARWVCAQVAAEGKEGCVSGGGVLRVALRVWE